MASYMINLFVMCLLVWMTIPSMNGQSESMDDPTPIIGDETELDTGSDIPQTCYLTDSQLVSITEATTDKVLRQAQCNNRELEDKVANFGTQLSDQLNILKTMMLNIEDKMIDQENQNKRQHRKLMSAIYKSKRGQRGVYFRSPSLGDYEQGEVDEAGGREEDDNTSNVREEEIEMYNSTIHSDSNHRIFTYYWRVTGVEYKMTGWNQRRSLRSQSFYIFRGGYRMYMRIYPKQSGKNVYIHVGITQGEFDDALEWPFKLKNKINVLDQSEFPEDISSRVWDPAVLCSGWNWRKPVRGDNYECVGLGFPHDVLRSRNYILNDSIVIKLTVFLD